MTPSLLIDLFFVLFVFFYLLAMFIGAPFIPGNRQVVKRMMLLSGSLKGRKVVDLGSGEGRVVIGAAQAGAKEAHGYEINPFLVLVSWWRIYRAGVWGKAFVHWASYWGKDLSSFDTVFVYGISHIMKRLEKKMDKELRSGALIVSNSFTFPGWKFLKSDGQVYLYRKSHPPR